MSNRIGIHIMKQWLEVILDDTSLFGNNPGDSDIGTLMRTLETDEECWESLLSVSGGCLELSKSSYA